MSAYINKWETVIGLEVHVELSTKTKIFCGCLTEFGGEPNCRVCPVCAGMPGALPMLNRTVVEYAMRLGVTLDCTITKNCKFDRKNYFYPDLPKAYQVSQLYLPICRNGQLEIDGKKSIRINEIHMEEDAGKLIHDKRGTFMDFNRCGVPLLEIVTQPDFKSAHEVTAFLEKLREILLFLDISDCKMQEGSLRADVNLSVHRPAEGLGIRTETKNLNSFKAIARAIEYERGRQIEILENGGTITQETRRWDDDIGQSYGMRSKENAQDYRYFPEPDLLPIEINESWLASIKKQIPELAHQKRTRYVQDLGLSEYDATVLTRHKNISYLFEKTAEKSGNAKESARLVSGEIMRLMGATKTLPEDLDIDEVKLATLVAALTDGKINREAYKETIEAVYLRNAEPESFIEERGLWMVSDLSAISQTVEKIVAAHPEAVADYRAGKTKAFGFLMGQAMKKLGKAGNPETLKAVLTDFL